MASSKSRKKLWWVVLGATGLFGLCCLGSFVTNRDTSGTNGTRYDTNPAAGLFANESDTQVWLTEIVPGGQVTGTIVYDLPRGAELAQLELHDSAASAGVRIDLR